MLVLPGCLQWGIFKKKIARELGSEAGWFVIAGYVFPSSASAELLLKQNRTSSSSQAALVNKGVA